MDIIDVKSRISEFRKWLRLGQQSVADYLDISKSAMSSLESIESKRGVEVDELLKLCKLFMCEPHELIGSRPLIKDLDAVFNTRMTSSEKELSEGDKAELDFFHFELKEMKRNNEFSSKGKEKTNQSSIAFAVEELLNRTNSNKIPIDVFSIASQLGIFVKFSALSNLSGAYIHGGNDNGPGILLNSNQPENRIRFSLAHEVAHYYLNHYSNQEIAVSLLGRHSLEIEKDADKFASELLVPKKILDFEVRNISNSGLSEVDVFKLSDKFAVSYQAMLMALLKGGYITQSQYDYFCKLKVSEIKNEINFTKKDIEFDPEILQDILTKNNFELENLNRDSARLIQEMAYQQYITNVPIERRKTEVKDVYEQVVFWLVDKRDLILKQSLTEIAKKTLESFNVEYIDKTSNGGCIWVLSNSKNDGVIDSLKRKNIHFKFSENGGKATKNKPSWYLKVGEENK